MHSTMRSSWQEDRRYGGTDTMRALKFPQLSTSGRPGPGGEEPPEPSALQTRLYGLNLNQLKRSLLITALKSLNPSREPLPKPNTQFTRRDFGDRPQEAENYVHLRDNVNILNHDA